MSLADLVKEADALDDLNKLHPYTQVLFDYVWTNGSKSTGEECTTRRHRMSSVPS